MSQGGAAEKSEAERENCGEKSLLQPGQQQVRAAQRDHVVSHRQGVAFAAYAR